MYPIRLNLLSPSKKAHLKRMSHFQFIKSIFEILLITTSVLAMILLGSQTVLQTYFAELTENVVAVNNEHVEETREILRINKLLEEVQQVQKGYIAWTPLVAEIASSTPHGVTLSNFNIDMSSKKMTLSGYAETRDIFLQFQDELRGISFVSSINSPLSDLTKPEDIAFNITASLY
ncbi:hypothetical protein C0581_04160 [Candidatus Parcubacteria bacterium]|nr:MAG: hypothetical protein C0581_04160 [Candidatus Parcubacteria bacterium]